MNRIVDEIRAIIEECYADINLCYIVYNIIAKEKFDDRSYLFREFSNLIKVIKSSKNRKLTYINEDEFHELAELLIVKAESQIKYLILKAEIEDFTKEEFDKELWSYIESFDTVNEKAFLMLYYCLDSRYPYFNINHYLRKYIMSDDEYNKNKVEYGLENLSKVRYVIASEQFTQYTEQAYAFLKLIEEAESEIGKVLIITEIIKYLDWRPDEQRIEQCEKTVALASCDKFTYKDIN